jgi:hypothetical protein
MANVMTIAWAIFRKRYIVRFKDARQMRKAFAVALKSAWMTIRADRAALAANDAQVASTKLW